MDFLTIMHTYFRGEKLEAALFILPVGLLFLGLAVGAWRTEWGGFMWGALVPSALVGLVFTGVGVGIAARTGGQVAGLEAGFQGDVVAMVQAELPRMQQVMRSFANTLTIMGVLAALGLALRFGVRTPWAMGLGSVLVAAGGVGLLIDGFAERRAHPYVAALEQLASEHGVDLSTGVPGD